MSRAHCFVLSSNYETFGVVLIEALASGLPLIATRSGGPEDIINSGNGLLTGVGNIDELATAMLFMTKNYHNYDREQLRYEAVERFGDEAFVSRAIEYYNKCIDKIKTISN